MCWVVNMFISQRDSQRQEKKKRYSTKYPSILDNNVFVFEEEQLKKPMDLTFIVQFIPICLEMSTLDMAGHNDYTARMHSRKSDNPNDTVYKVKIKGLYN